MAVQMDADGARDTAGARLLDPRMQVQHARDPAGKARTRRERAVAQMARMLAGRRVEPDVIDEVVGELIEQGYLDDASYAQRFTEDRRQLDGWGAERIERRLRALGISSEAVHDAVGTRDHGEELAAAVALL